MVGVMKRLVLGLVLLASLAFAACSDSDGGRVYGTKGFCQDPFKNRTDYCLDSQMLVEYYCSGTTIGECKAVQQTCPWVIQGSSCNDGACGIKRDTLVALPKPSPTPSPTPTAQPVLIEEGYTPQQERIEPVQTLPFWLAAAALAVLFVLGYRYSEKRALDRQTHAISEAFAPKKAKRKRRG